ncbi:MAG: hypothetical protein ACKVVT_03475 [Dehalococcoidia bacterium]
MQGLKRIASRVWGGIAAMVDTPLGAAGAAIVVGLTVIFIALAVVWLSGGLRTTGDSLDWAVVEALAAVITALAALAGFAAIAAGFEQQRASRRAERLALMPYLRVDVGFLEPHARHRGFEPPHGYVFDVTDFGSAADAAGLDGPGSIARCCVAHTGVACNQSPNSTPWYRLRGHD